MKSAARTFHEIAFSLKVPRIAFFLTAVAESAGETIAVVERLQDLQRGYRERLQTARRSALMLRIIDLAFASPVRSITDFPEVLEVTYGGAANNIAELIAQEVAEELGGTYPKLIRFLECWRRCRWHEASANCLQ